MKLIVIGITDNCNQYFTPEVLNIIRAGHSFSGGKRHHELVQHLLPMSHEWIDVTVPLQQVFDDYRKQFLKDETLIVFASGDPLFYGYGTTLRREFPNAEMLVFPTFNSLQLLAHRLLLPYQDMCCTSITGRPWKGLDDALIRGEQIIGCLTDKYKTPYHIAQRMLEYGYDQYEMHVGECLGNPEEERVTTYGLSAVTQDTKQPNCVILKQIKPHKKHFGIPEQDFHLLDGRVNMITKAPIRLLTLSALDLANRNSFWDVGFCTGSVSIEARLQFPHLHIESFEIRPEGERLMDLNCHKFGAPGIQVHIGDFMQASLDELPRPDAVFIGGHGGHLKEMVARIKNFLLPGGIIVFNSVSAQSQEAFQEAAGTCETTRIALDEHNPIIIMSWKQS